MADVNVNIRGKDEGLGSQLDSLRQKAIDLGKDLSEVNNFEEKTQTQKKVAVQNLGENTLREQQEKIKQEYDNIRKSNIEEYKAQKERLSPQQFSKFEKEYKFDQDDLRKQEDQELKEVEKEMNDTLKDIHKELTNSSKIEREKAQRDREEFKQSGGVKGRILNENKDLRKQQYATEDESEVAEIQSKIDANNERLKNIKSSGNRDVDLFKEFGSTAASASSGDLMGTISGVTSGAGKFGKLAKGATITGIIAMVLKEALGTGDKLREAIAPTASLRGGFESAEAYSNKMRAEGGDFSMNSQFDLGALGISNEQQAQMMREKALKSGVNNEDLFRRTFEEQAFQKGFGADVSGFSEFERFSENQKEATSIGLDVLNVLTSIEESSLKEKDLTTLTEKLSSQQSILSFQRQKQDLVNSDQALKILSSFESAGLSAKGEKSTDFINQTLSGLSEGGSEIQQMLKIEAAKRANPELVNDPAALRRKVRFNPQDPKYMQEFFNMAKEMTGGNQMAMDDLLFEFFNPESEMDMNIYENLMNGDNPEKLLRGDSIRKMKQRKRTLDKDTMVTDAESGIGTVTQAMTDFSNRSQSFMDTFSDLFRSLITGEAVNVNILKDKTPKNTGNNKNNTIYGPKPKSGM